MSLWLEEKYLRFLAPQLNRFAQKNRHTWNFRCPLCGDSEVKKTKARGYIFAKQQMLMFKCHNCDIALPFVALLRRMSPRLYDEMLLEQMREAPKAIEAPPIVLESPVSDDQRGAHVFPLNPLASLPAPLSVVWNYVVRRLIGVSAMKRLYATVHARTWLAPLVGMEKAGRVIDNEPYLVMPMTLPNGEWFGAQLRMIGRKEYITFRWSHAPLKAFGLDHLKPTENIWIVEGPLDSLFVPNALAILGSDLMGGVRVLEDAGVLHTNTPRTYVWDCEKRNRQILNNMEVVIMLNQSIVIWPKGFQHKDVNDAVLAGIDVVTLLQQRTFTGLRAQLEFAEWKK